jgi:hypothetical protein
MNAERTASWPFQPMASDGQLGFSIKVAAGLVAMAALTSFTGIGSTDLSIGNAPTATRLMTRPNVPPPPPNQLSAVAPALAKAVNDARPALGTLEGAPAVQFAGGLLARERAIECLAAAAYYEAGDDWTGQRAVVQVVLNRARHPSYPKTVCGVVFQGSERRTGCQFTFTCDGSLARTPSRQAWTRARAISSSALNGAVDLSVGAATHYHADYVLPKWSANLVKLTKVGAHIFYRFPGSWGRSSVFRKSVQPSDDAIIALQRLSAVPVGTDVANMDQTSLAPPELDLAGLVDAPSMSALASNNSIDKTEASSAIMLVPSPGSAAGGWAVDAMRRCAGRSDCQVFGWRSNDQLERNRMKPGQSGERPVFLFIRDRVSGMNVALWDCGVVLRPNVSECLPTNPAAVQRLLRKRD